MGKLTDEQAKALAELEALRDADDTDDEYEVVMERDGHTIRVPWSKVPPKWREHFGFTDPGAAAGDGQGDGQGDGKGSEGDPKPPSRNRYFT